MSLIDKYIEQFSEIFHGYDRGYGKYMVNTVEDGGKHVGPRATVKGEVTPELWRKHLSGEQGLGIVVINEKNECKFGAIDIDIYDGLDYQEIIDKIEKFQLPLIPFRSKSGGLHAFVFLAEWVPAKLMREKLKEWATGLGFGTSEIFPKQDKVLEEKGDIGNWINIPYFDYQSTNRYAFDKKSRPLKITDFLSLVSSMSLTKKEFKAAKIVLDSDLEDAPPCIECLLVYSVEKGMRNDTMFSLAIYLKKAYQSNWQNKVVEFNHKYFNPPLPISELDKIIKSVDKKDYYYKCSNPPLSTYCNQSVCKTRLYGIDAGMDFPVLSCLTKYDARPPIWFVDVEGGGRIEVSTEALQNQGQFQKVCMEELNTVIPTVKRPKWVSIIKELFENITIIEAPKEATPEGQLMEMVEEMCTGRSTAREREEILRGKAFTEKGKHFFQLKDVMKYLERHSIRDFKRNKVASILRDNGGSTKQLNLKGRNISVWSIPEFEKQTEPFNKPDSGPTEVI